MTDLADVSRLAGADHHLAVFAVARPDGSVHASVVSAGIIADPVDGSPGVAAVLGGGARKLALLRRDRRATLVFKSGWDWAAVRARCAWWDPTTAPTSGSTCRRRCGRSSRRPAGRTRTGPSSTASWRRSAAAPLLSVRRWSPPMPAPADVLRRLRSRMVRLDRFPSRLRRRERPLHPGRGFFKTVNDFVDNFEKRPPAPGPRPGRSRTTAWPLSKKYQRSCG